MAKADYGVDNFDDLWIDTRDPHSVKIEMLQRAKQEKTHKFPWEKSVKQEATISISSDKINELEKRITELEKRSMSEYQKNKSTDGSDEVEHDFSVFFQNKTNIAAWKKLFNELEIPITNQDIFRIAEVYKIPVKK